MTISLPPVSSSYGMSLQEMIDDVSDELRNVTITSKIVRWLNKAIIHLASRYVFGTLHQYGSATTTIGLPDILLPLDIHWLKGVEIPSIRRKIWPKDEQRIAETNPDYRTRQGFPFCYYLNGLYVGLWYVPSAEYLVTFPYQRRPIKLVNPTDFSDLPPEWHEVVVQRAVTQGFRYDGNTAAAAESQTTEKVLIRQLSSVVYRRLDEIMVLGGDDSSYSRPPRPKLPPSFPVR